MTVASEISRLQTDKECIRQAIIGKGVDVASNLTLDSYAACINAISTGPKTGYIDLLVVGGGGNGVPGMCCGAGAGGGAGGFVEYNKYMISSEQGDFSINVGTGGGLCGVQGDSCFGDVIAYGGGGGCGNIGYGCGKVDGGSGTGQNTSTNGSRPTIGPGNGVSGQGNHGGYNNTTDGTKGGGGGGGGAGREGGNATASGGGAGGCGRCSSISGANCWYAGGGGGGGQGWSGTMSGGVGGCGGGGAGGCGNSAGCNASYYGGGGGGGGCRMAGGCGYQGVVILRYKTDGSCGLLPTSYGGCRYTCGQYTIHCFTNTSATETFIPVFK